MTEKTIKNIYSEFIATFKDNTDFGIEFYEKNSIFFNKIDHFKDKEELILYIEIVYNYVSSIYCTGRYNNAIDIIDQKIMLIDNEIQRLSADELKGNFYYSLYFVKGMASNKLKDNKTAIEMFEKLIQYDNQNDRFKLWLNDSKYAQRMWFIRIITIICTFLITTQILFNILIPKQYFYPRIGFAVIGVLGILAVQTYEHYVRRSFRKKKTNE